MKKVRARLIVLICLLASHQAIALAKPSPPGITQASTNPKSAAAAAGGNGAADRDRKLKRLNSMIDERSFREANDFLDQLSAAYPGDYDIRLAGAKLYREMGMFARSMAEYKLLMKTNSARVEAPLALSQMYLLYLDPRQALSFARQAVATAPRDKNARIALTSALISSGYLKEAEGELNILTKTNSQDADVHYVAYKLMLERGQLSNARHELDEAIKERPSNTQWLLDLSDLCKLEGDYPDAKELLERTIRSDPSSVDKIGKLALMEEYCFRDYDEAINQYTKMLQIDPDSVTALTGLDRCKMKENDMAAILKERIRSIFASGPSSRQ